MAMLLPLALAPTSRRTRPSVSRKQTVPSHGEIFNDIYRRDLWQGGSGAGSREELTRDYRAMLQQFLGSNAVTSVVDVGCGDWQFSRHMNWGGIDYTGTDASDV